MRVYQGDGAAVATEGTGAAMQVPARPEDLAAHYDLTISHPGVRMDLFAAFDRYLAEAASDYDLSCALIHDGVVHEAIARLGQGRLGIGFHLDYFALWHVATDPYARLAAAVEDAGGRPVNAPARARAFTDKAAAHGELLRHGLGVPPAVLIRPWTANRPLTAREQATLRLHEPGARVYIKPANGSAGRGVVRVERTDPEGLEAALADARQLDRHDTYLIQREVSSPLLACEDGCARPAYWRVLHCLGEWTVFWWQPQDRSGGRPSYRWMTAAEMRRHRLQPVLEYAKELSELTGLEWFSTELCLSNGPEWSRYTVTGSDGRPRPVLAIDYVNDQCDVDVQSRWPGAPPDHVVRRLAERFAEAAWRQRQATVRPPAVIPWREAA
jgi:hypothetical protein